jgi:hypothetical protein
MQGAMTSLEGWWAEPTAELLAMMASVAASFEASELKHQLTRAGFMPPAHWHPTPFIPAAFHGDIVLTSGDSPSEFYGPCIDDAACIFFSGVVKRALLGGLVRPERDGRAELQVGIVMTERLVRIMPISGSWTLTRAPRGEAGMLTLASRIDLRRLLDESDESRRRLLEKRNAFYESRWRELFASRLVDRLLHGT